MKARLVRIRERSFFRVSVRRIWTCYHRGDQRFNFKKENTRTCYLAEDRATCVAEAAARGLTAVGLLYVARARIDLEAWDLRRPDRELDPSTARMVRDPDRHHRRVKMLGSRARRIGVQAILYESVRSPGKACLVVFLDNVSARGFRQCGWKPV